MACWMALTSLVVFMVSSIIGILLFTRGFLLSRIAIANSTQSTDTPTSQQYGKVIVIVIDALRFDFVEEQPSSHAYYHNKLTFVHKLLSEDKDRTHLYKFIADPPTTTMQRLKGLTTGGLPTFVDAGSNFASSEVNEDNIIQQLMNANKTTVFMGDDTWESLFTGRFSRSYPFPSFNVHDLHTVDQGVKKHLLPEIQRDDYTVLIAHFLGVDHCGHRYSPDHPAMAEKLSEMNEVLRSVVEAMNEDTLLVVLGDHGMTRTGDHGGDSDAEIEAALLLHTKSKVKWPVHQELEVSQIDLVPTLSVLLGLPIPYSNLGSVIPELIENKKTANSNERLIHALKTNQQQITNYLQHYNQLSNDLPKPQMSVLKEMEANLVSMSTESKPDMEKLKSKYLAYMKKVKDMCREVWAKFDDGLMIIGCLQVLFCIIIQTCSVCGLIGSTDSCLVIYSHCALTALSLTLSYLAIIAVYSIVILSTLFIIVMAVCRSKGEVTENRLLATDIISALCLVLYSLSSLSNSLLINEDKVLHFLLQSVITFISIMSIVQRISSEHVKPKEKITPTTYLFKIFKYPITYILVVFSVVLQLSQTFHACREELAECETSLYFTPLASLRQDLNSYRNWRFWFLTVPSVVIPVSVVQRILKVRGNLNGHSPVTTFVSYALTLMAILCIMDWVSAAATSLLLEWQRIIFARVVYTMQMVCIVIVFVKPLAVYLSVPKKRNVTYNGSIPSLYKYIKQTLYTRDADTDMPLVFGLSTVYSAAYLTLLTATALYLMLISGDGMSASLSLALLALCLFLDIHTIVSRQHKSTSLSHIICWFLLAKYYFYCTGHQPTITNIRWDSAFHGFAQDHESHIIPGILLFTSTFSAQALFTLSLPLLLIVTESGLTFYQSLRLPESRSLTGLGEVALTRQEETTYSSLHQLVSVYMLANLIKSFGALVSAALLRRHLMVWKIFAPAFIYEGASFILTSLVSLIAYLLFIRITRAVKYFTKDFELEHVD